MLQNRKELPELWNLKHRHDSEDRYVDYENSILDNSLSPYLYENDVMNGYLKRLQKLTSVLIDQMNVAKNFKNHLVDKYHFKQLG
jgi:hypothetical protein